METRSFGWAIKQLMNGSKIARSGWNGKNMWLIHIPGQADVELKEGSKYHSAGLTKVDILPHIDMMTATGQMQPGWLASQSDILAIDWEIVN